MRPFAFVFPGQGSQSVGMLDAWNDHPVVREILAEASDALGQDLGALIREGTKETLALTTHTQPVMLVAGVAAFRVWMAETGTLPAVVAGHSLGEYSALVAAGVLSLASAAPLVRFRAQAMQDAVPVGTGAMAAIMGMPADQVIDGCAEALRTFGGDTLEVVEAVNFNDPLQT
ncbi:MAG: malonyl CoA-acyl carrier protein transacylase, partial [Polaromonas sp. 28-63-22]